MQNIEYLKAESIADAVSKLESAGDSATILAGGTDLLVGYNSKPVKQGTTIVYIGEIEEMKAIEETEKELRIGSLVTTAEIAESPLIARYARGLQQAAQESAGPQVRNRATIGGNIATASPAGDMISPLYALGASVAIAGKNGNVIKNMSEVIIGVKKTALTRDQIITQFIIPKSGSTTESAFEKIGKRKAMTISSANAACQVTLDKDCTIIKDLRVSVGAAGPTIGMAHNLANALRGNPVDHVFIKEKSRLACEVISPITDQRATRWYRQEVVPVLVYNVIIKAIAQVKNSDGGVQ